MKATWNGITIAESDKTIIVEGNHYFPPESIQQAYFEGNDHTTICPWKGKANYYTLTDGNGNRAENAAWYYAEPKSAAAEIKGHIAFYPVVTVTK